jgi:hypothetical protein
MQIMYTGCDRCNSKDARPIGIVTGRYTDAAGSGADITLDADLCDKCASVLFGKLLYSLPVDMADKFLRGLSPLGKGTRLFTEHR